MLYRVNIFVFKFLGVIYILVSGVIGFFCQHYALGDLVIVD